MVINPYHNIFKYFSKTKFHKGESPPEDNVFAQFTYECKLHENKTCQCIQSVYFYQFITCILHNKFSSKIDNFIYKISTRTVATGLGISKKKQIWAKILLS